jgi:trimeric autotransporter adhesin
VGTTTTSAAFNFTVENRRDVALAYTLAVSGVNASNFSVASHTSSGAGCSAGSVPASVGVGSRTCTVSLTVNFTPSAAGVRSAALGLNISAVAAVPASSRSIAALTATGVTPVPSFGISPASRTFTARVGTAVTQNFTISNTGTGPLSLTSFGFSLPSYTRAASSTCSTANPVAAGASCTLTVSFLPTAAGTANATLTVNHNATGSPGSVGLQGTGTLPNISASATSLGFGNSQVGVPRALPAISLTNTGTAPLVFSVDPASAAARSGPAASDYSMASTCSTGSPLAAGASCTVTGTFTPSALGARNATLTISSDASSGPLLIALTGSGTALPEPVVTPPTLAFPTTVIGETATLTLQVTITNGRTRNITYSVTNLADFSVAPGGESCPTRVVPGGGSCTITWRFQPGLGGGESVRQGNLLFSFGGTLGDPAPSNATVSLTGSALLPIAQSATALNVAAVVGVPNTASLLLTNRSASGVLLGPLAFSGGAAADYSLAAANTCTPGLSLAAGANCTLMVRFNPATAGARNATLSIAHGAAGSPQSVLINGTATPAPQGRIELSALSLGFANTALSGTAVLPLTVRNAGDLALNFSAFNITGAASTEFERGGDCSTSTPLPVGAQCSLTLTFRPAALGVRSASLTLLSDASNGPATIALSGTGVPVPAPVVSLVPSSGNASSLEFGSQTLGGLYPPRTVRLLNAGTADLVTSAIAVLGANFALAGGPACPATLAPGAACDIAIAFSPSAANTDFSGSLRVTSNAAGSPHAIGLQGRGSLAVLPVLVWSPVVTPMDFGSVSAGTVSGVRSATLLNQGPGGVRLAVLNAVGADATAFSVAGGTCLVGQTLFEGQSCSVNVSFAPATAGAKNAMVQVASSGSAPPALALVGTGLAGPSPSLAPSLATLGFEATRVGAQSLPSELALRSVGSGAVQVTGLVVTGPYTVAPKSCPSLPFSLAAGSECTVIVTFAPLAEGNSTGSLRINSTSGPVDVALSGRADAAAPVTSGGGCSLANGDSARDPTLWVLLLLAVWVLLARHRAGRRP